MQSISILSIEDLIILKLAVLASSHLICHFSQPEVFSSMYYNNKSHDLQIIICSSVDNESIIKKMIKKSY